MPQRKRQPVLRFHGVPSALSALVADALLPDPDAVVEARLATAVEATAASLQLHHAPAGAGARWLQLSLPEDTPPGDYEGAVTVGDIRYAMVASVVAEPNLLLSPAFVQSRAAPAARVSATFTVANTGNVSCEIPRAGAFGLFENDGLEDAIGAALRQDARGQERLGRLADELAERHGGLTVVAYGEGRGALAPGDVRDLEVTFRLPAELRHGRSYSGTWPLANVRCRVDFQIQEDDQ